MSSGNALVSSGQLTVRHHKVWYEHEEFSWGMVRGVDIWRYEESELTNGEELMDLLENQAQYQIEPPHWDGDETYVCRIDNRLIEVTLFRVPAVAQSG